ncbi:E3 ubiquitin-protein ligase sh3rf1 [Phlyctochytrium planicorne]|nr:E3 ubiquitin-protein ligase sh3rf1 [Phlyctochytrium planicorne]
MLNLAQFQRDVARRQNGHLRLIDDKESGTKWILKCWMRNHDGIQSVEVRLFDSEVQNKIYETEISRQPHLERIHNQLCSGPIYKVVLEGMVVDGKVVVQELGLYLDEQCLFPFRLAPRTILDGNTLTENMNDAMALRPVPEPQIIQQFIESPQSLSAQGEQPQPQEPKIGGFNNIIIGNRGVGKSTFLNFILGEALFMPSSTRDELRSPKPSTVRLKDGRIFIESAAIENPARRKESIRETLKLINEGGEFCIIFIVELGNDSSVRAEDLKLMQDTLDGYGIIVNKIDPELHLKLAKEPFAQFRIFGPCHSSHHEPKILYVPKNKSLETDLFSQTIPDLNQFLQFNSPIERRSTTVVMNHLNGTPELQNWLRESCNLTRGYILEPTGPREGKIDVLQCGPDPAFLNVSFKNSSTTDSEINSTETLKTYAQKGWKQRMFMAGNIRFGLNVSDQNNTEDEAHRKSKVKFISISILHPRATISLDKDELKPSRTFQQRIDECLQSLDEVEKRRKIEELLKESGQVLRTQFTVGGAFRQISKHVGLSDEEMESKKKEKLFQFSSPLGVRAATDNKSTEVVTTVNDSECDKFEVQGGKIHYVDKIAWASTITSEFKTWDVIEVLDTIPVIDILATAQRQEIYNLFELIPPTIPSRPGNIHKAASQELLGSSKVSSKSATIPTPLRVKAKGFGVVGWIKPMLSNSRKPQIPSKSMKTQVHPTVATSQSMPTQRECSAQRRNEGWRPPRLIPPSYENAAKAPPRTPGMPLADVMARSKPSLWHESSVAVPTVPSNPCTEAKARVNALSPLRNESTSSTPVIPPRPSKQVHKSASMASLPSSKSGSLINTPLAGPSRSSGSTRGGLTYKELAGINANSPAQQSFPPPPYFFEPAPIAGSDGFRSGTRSSNRMRANSSPSVASAGGAGVEGRTCVAVKDFMRGDNGDLQFKKGEVIQIKHSVDKHWSYGTLNGQEGKFPLNHVRMGVAATVVASSQGRVSRRISANLGFARAVANLGGKDDGEIKAKKGDLIKLTSKGDRDLYMGKVDGVEGWVHSSKIELVAVDGAARAR